MQKSFYMYYLWGSVWVFIVLSKFLAVFASTSLHLFHKTSAPCLGAWPARGGGWWTSTRHCSTWAGSTPKDTPTSGTLCICITGTSGSMIRNFKSLKSESIHVNKMMIQYKCATILCQGPVPWSFPEE